MEKGDVVSEKYRVVDVIGRGGMGAVYEVEHEITGKRLALKTLLPGLAGVPEIIKRFEREARALGVLQHPNVVGVTDFGETDDGSLFLVLELARGRSLADALETEVFGVERAGTIIRQVLDALGHAHEAGVVHRDLKPDNIMLTDHGESADERDVVKLLDFGIAKLVGDGDLTQAGIAFGTPAYMAPEQALGEPVDGRADIYAAGVILFEMLAGRPPFVSEEPAAVMRMQVAVDPPTLAKAAPDRTFAPALEAVLARALAKPRAERFATAGAMLEAFDAAIGEQRDADGAEAGRIATGILGGWSQLRRARVVLGLALAGAIALAVMGVVLARGGDSPAPRGDAPAAVASLGNEDELYQAAIDELQNGESCRERAGAIPTLRMLGDKRAIPALKRARDRKGGILGLEHINGCLSKDAKEAIDTLEKLP
jgi:hypothetical protein